MKHEPIPRDETASHEQTLPESRPEGDAPVRVCVIDLGTNSFHAVVVDVHPGGTFKRVDRLKETVHLGEGESLENGHLTDPAMTRAFEALERICLLAKGWEVREFVACATSALREAENGGSFIERVRHELGLIVRPISGVREAELIYRGVRHAVDLDTPALVVDIGGGSVECVVGDRTEAHFATSLKLGAARMTARFAKSDPLSKADAEAMRAHYREALGEVCTASRKHGVQNLVGSSGTVESLAAVCAHRHGRGDESIFQQTYSAAEFGDAAAWVAQASTAARHACEQIEERRVEQIPAGAVLMEVLLDALPEVESVRVSPYALREGMVVNFIEERHAHIRRLAPLGSVRRRSVVELGVRFDWEEAHARHVAEAALALFDAVRSLLPPEAPDADGHADRELLEYAALLHDVGYHISHEKHERHSQYLIEHAGLHGFTGREVRLLALVARYHRGAAPSEGDAGFAALDEHDRARVRRLASLLRLAEALDRSHLQVAQALAPVLTEDALELKLRSDGGDLRLEQWAVEQNKALFETVFGRAVKVDV